MAAAVQRCTLRWVQRTISIIDSHGFVEQARTRAAVLLGRSAAGPIEWKTESGQTLKALREQTVATPDDAGWLFLRSNQPDRAPHPRDPVRALRPREYRCACSDGRARVSPDSSFRRPRISRKARVADSQWIISD